MRHELKKSLPGKVICSNAGKFINAERHLLLSLKGVKN